ncbi:uncharacterized protein CDAR_621171 [Caerostris darwini]|uniref:Uncharacterized protein n=1 Tax=Caerostris darwini TaxID=1538125 RepID=A0AAV4RR72_9ARAC|nr:uncharacterized protein CDAR_621171 [Caerostris darwini]
MKTNDLSWNNIGLIGGRIILKSLSKNKTALLLEISGNDLSSDILEAIQIATSANAQRYIANNEYLARSKFLASKLQEKEEERNIQVKSLMEQIEKMDKDALMSERWNSEKLVETHEMLTAKDKICENLTSKIRELENELHILSETNNKLALNLNANEFKYKKSIEELKTSLTKERKQNEKHEMELIEKVGALKEENIFLKQQIQDLKISQTHSLEQISKLESASKQDQESFKEKLVFLNEKHTEVIQENEDMHQKEISRIRDDFLEHEKILKQKISLLESHKNDLEQELKEKSSQVFEERKHAEEMYIQLEKKLKSDHEIIRQQLEERIAMLEDANREQNDHLQRDLQVLYQLKTDITGLDLELSEQSHEILHLKKCLEEKDAEMKINEAKIKLEVREKLDELEKSKENLQLLNQQNSSYLQKIKEMENNDKEELNSKTEIIQNLMEEIEQYQNKIKEMIKDEKNRTAQLQRAFEAYTKSYINNDPSGDKSHFKSEK